METKPKHIILSDPEVIAKFIVGKSEEQIKQKTRLSDEGYVAVLLGAKILPEV